MSRRSWLIVPLGLSLVAAPGPTRSVAEAASKVAVAAIGDPAPGGGVFAGPSFTAWPAAAGDGWLAFRSSFQGGSTSEVLVAARMTPPTTRVQIARIGQAAPGADEAKFKQFLARPAINASGDVAFTAAITDKSPDGTTETRVGVFLFRQGAAAGKELSAVALSGDATPAGTLDLGAALDAETTGLDVPARTPALNDGGDVAFLSATKETPGVAAIYLKAAGQDVAVVASAGTPYDDGSFDHLGPPALNDAGQIAFRATIAGSSMKDRVLLASGGTIATLVASGVQLAEEVPSTTGQPPTMITQVLTDFGDGVALNDQGVVAFTAGPLLDPTRPDEDGLVGAFVLGTDGMLHLLAAPGQQMGGGRVTSVTLGPNAGSEVSPPDVAPDGTALFLVSINGGTSQAIMMADPPAYTTTRRLVLLGGDDPSPAGGNYGLAASAPVIDGANGVAFLARIVAGGASEAVFYRAADGTTSAVVEGDPAPTSQGFYAGPPFTVPHIDDQGDVVFRAYVAGAATSLGLFRFHAGALAPLVFVGDTASGLGVPFTDLPGEPSVNAGGSVVFSGEAGILGRGIFLADAAGLRAIVLRGDPAPGPTGATFQSLGVNPSINDNGGIAFRGSIRFDDGQGNLVSQSGVFLLDQNGTFMLAAVQGMSPTGLPFVKLRDPVISGVPSLVFRAPVGTEASLTDAIFSAELTGITTVAFAGDDLGDGVVFSGFSGTPAVDAAGDIAFLATRARAGRDVGPGLLRRLGGNLEQLIAKGMRGPAGGTVRSLGAPAMSRVGHIAFRTSFERGTGGTSGYLLSTDSATTQLVGTGETTPIGGRFSSFGARGTINGNDQLAFIGNVSRGDRQNGIFIASPTTLGVRPFTLRISRGRSRVHLSLTLATGILTDGIDPANDTITVSVADATGTLWTGTVANGKLRPRRRAFIGSTRKEIQRLRLAISGRGARVDVRSVPVDLTSRGKHRVTPPVTVTLEIGDDSGSATFACRVRGRTAHCGR